ncbi:MAG: transcription antitermination factor NusB [Ilumatobacteraceae bacterium]
MTTPDPAPRTARRVALDAIRRIDSDGAYANLVLGPMLGSSGLGDMDRRFVTDLVYGTTRMRRACDAVIDRFITSPPDEATRSVLRLGAYQLIFAGVPPHAAVGETVGLAPKRTRGFVNAVLRKVARLSVAEMSWPSDGARLSYPDWIVDTFRAEVGDDAVEALQRMNTPPPVTERADGYVQDESSQWVAAAVEARPGERVLDVCAAPGGKATAIANGGAAVVAADQRLGRARLVQDNVRKLGLDLPAVAADGTAAPFRPGSFDAVLLDAPCSGLGALRRRADARWRIQPSDVVELADLQGRLLASAAQLVAPGGRLVYSVCTITAAESTDHATPDGFEVDPTPPADGTWRPFEQGWRVLPQDADTDGMVLIRYRRSA